jgi:hypothetical protein
MDNNQYAITWESVRNQDEWLERGDRLVVSEIIQLDLSIRKASKQSEYFEGWEAWDRRGNYRGGLSGHSQDRGRELRDDRSHYPAVPR